MAEPARKLFAGKRYAPVHAKSTPKYRFVFFPIGVESLVF